MKKNFLSPDLNYLALKFSDPQLDPRLLDCLLQTFLSIFSCSLDYSVDSQAVSTEEFLSTYTLKIMYLTFSQQ